MQYRIAWPLMVGWFLIVMAALWLCCGAASALEVTLGWNANTESILTGYRVYRGSSSRQYTETFDTGMLTPENGQVEFSLSAQDGVKLYYAITALGNCTDGPCESDYSNEVYAPSSPAIPQHFR